MPEPTTDMVEAFLARWSASGGHERANYQLFLAELCDLLDVPRPDPARPENAANAYVFERSVNRAKPDGTATTNYLDLYKSGCFVLETKQGASALPASPEAPSPRPSAVSPGRGIRGTAGYDKALERAYNQASGYIQDLPAAEGRPPFLIVCDVGHIFEIYAEFTRSGGRYQRFPDPKNHRLPLTDLRDPAKRALLRSIWTDPLSLDPSKRVAKVTRDIAGRLARLAKSLEADRHHPEVVALFLQRCLFTLFAEDIGLLPERGFLELLRKIEDTPQGFPVLVTNLWKEMAIGTDFSAVLLKKVAHFNGGLFENPTALPLTVDQISLLIDAAEADWAEVDPAIFGTLLERALDPRERHKLGAHYTPRSYVERLIQPTVIDPLRDEWDTVKAAAVQLVDSGQEKKARAEVEDYHHRLCQIRVLDPACGSGNFLYVTLEHLKRLEAEVLDFFEGIGGDRTLEMDSFKVRPEQFHGLELNPSAVSIAQLVLWIGYFQWHFKTTGKADTNDRPLLPKQNTILHQDAVLAYDAKIPRKDADGKVVTLWDGVTTKPHPVTGKEVPDESARTVIYDYTNPRRPEWPEADYIVGNPPFVGASRMRDFLGDGYTEALRKAWKGDVPESADFVMFWWQRSAELLRAGKTRRFGFITTNSIRQTFNRRVLEAHLNAEKYPMHLAFAIPDHPWVDSADGAAVRIAMTVGSPGIGAGSIRNVILESEIEQGEHEVTLSESSGEIAPNLQLGARVGSAETLKANSLLSCPGVKLHGSGFIVNLEKAAELGLGRISGLQNYIRSYRNGRDLTSTPRGVLVIDLFELTASEVADKFPAVYQHILQEVKPERDNNNRATYKDNWWILGEPRRDFRPALKGLDRYIATVETSKHRFFVFLDASILPDNMLVNIASDEAWILGVLSSMIHVVWALAAGGRLGYGNDPRYNKTRCFETFPFPAPDEATRARIRDLGEKLDAHRKRQQAAHPGLTLTGIYNVLEKLRSGEVLTAKERVIHDEGLVSVLQQIHDDLDEAVFHAYGWDDLRSWYRDAARGEIFDPDTLSVTLLKTTDPAGFAAAVAEARERYDGILLERLVALNQERAGEEKRGLVRWLRPEFQNPEAGAAPAQIQLDIDDTEAEDATPATAKNATAAAGEPRSWPGELPAQVAAVRHLLAESGTDGTDPATLSARFGRKSAKREDQIRQIIETLRALGTV
ncbi:MAG: class I SAM-dependent DNA methyltransferase [Verrucomicrobiales bacterium]